MKTLICTFLLFAATTIQANGRDHRVAIQNVQIQKNNNQVTVRFEAVSQNFPADYNVTITPVLYGADSNLAILPELTLSGRKRDLRISATESPYVKMKKKQNSTVLYTQTIPFQEWMQQVSLAVQQTTEGCCSYTEYPVEQIAADIILSYIPSPFYDVKFYPYELSELEQYDLDNPFLHPVENYPRRYDFLKHERASGTSVLLFPVGSHKIEPDISGNKEVLEAIRKAFILIENDPAASLHKIVITGFASPDGSLAINTQLGQRRAEAVKNYIQRFLKNQPDSLFEVYNGREDWDGLRNLVEESSMPGKRDVLHIIDAYTIEQEERKTKLKQLGGGIPYRYMAENLFVQLRSAGYIQIYYGMQRSETGAKMMTDPQGKKIWIDPESPQNRQITAMNRSLELIVHEKYTEALTLLQPFNDDPRTWNNLGIGYMMTGDYVQAELFFRRAVQNGDLNAEKNLQQIELIKQLQ